MKKKDNEELNQSITSNLSFFNLLKMLSNPMRVTLAIATALMGISIFSFISIVAYFKELFNQFENMNIKVNCIIIVLLIIISLFFLSIILIACSSSIALIRFKFKENSLKENANEKIQELSDNIMLLNSEVSHIKLSKYILNEEQITKLESSTIDGSKIVVMTSKFHLDSGKLLKIIINNIKKGIIYQYIVPGEFIDGKIHGMDHNDFKTVYLNWWSIFLDDLLINEEENEIKKYNRDYQTIKRKALSLGKSQFNKIKNEAKKYFEKHVEEYLVGNGYRLVTIIMYQKGLSTQHNYDIIMKLPTVSDDNYYAFKIPDEEKIEKKGLIEIIESICLEDSIKLELN